MTNPRLTFLQDQVEAASEELQHTMSHMQESAAAVYALHEPQVPEPHRTWVDEMYGGIMSGEVKVCEHLSSPTPTAYLPSEHWLLCIHCLMGPYTEYLRQNPEANYRCDWCKGRFDSLISATLHSGPILIFGMVCAPCKDKIEEQVKAT